MDRANGMAAAIAQREVRDIATRQQTYGFWLQPLVDANEMEASVTENPPPDRTPAATTTPVRRGRGRPRVTQPRDSSTIEKRRAQVREAQRTYQKRKDDTTQTERKRCDEVLEVMSDLSSDVEALLQVVSKTGIMNQQGELADQIRRLWLSYDTAISSPCLKPELRLLQVKNDRRKAEHLENDCPRIDSTSGCPSSSIAQPARSGTQHVESDPTQLNPELANGTLIPAYQQVRAPRDRSMIDLVNERQSEFRNHLELQELRSSSLSSPKFNDDVDIPTSKA